ncbi:acetyltransferase [Methylobacterium sp. C25]|uniref:GNAT family N-acetyltransferase n=1 Tax=Methylobacterium sp. C25 TaxID=2721622 RepID=UPI001F1FC39F|nr:GNAT family N-acetyltransferase [Methylobacterium sp. C25]MCE4225629.1 acetyltransferase [Methylobacterium sp. C25]
MFEGDNTASGQVATLFAAGHGDPVTVTRQGDRLEAVAGGQSLASFRFETGTRRLTLLESRGQLELGERALAAVIEALIGWEPTIDRLHLDLRDDADLADRSCSSGLAIHDGPELSVWPAMAMQRRANWLSAPSQEPYPADLILTEGRRHPRRPPKPRGVVYARHIPWLGQTVSFRALTLDDVPLFNRWMNDPRVAAFWQEEGDHEKHRAYLSGLIADPHMIPMIGSFDDRPFGYFEIYWAKENRIAPFYDVDDWDRGWHVAVGEEAVRGRAYISAWLPSLMHYLFLDDPRTQRIVGEPAAHHTQQLRNLDVSGFARLKNFDFPHKRASLVMLLRERFFGDRLWQPAPARSGSAETAR